MLAIGVVTIGMGMVGQDVQRNGPRPTIVDVGGLELSMRSGLL
ncbi:hypothetical protein NRB20_34390 [Nocardia sp. RB20]|uniref:Uncharacterized protein n=1 Tax=Nocardia macrotermitis TaxID=2585198 RepID=A0A7K0D3M9_9NOCA|nr:hypothetical protein [Nocardia macrotermitis]